MKVQSITLLLVVLPLAFSCPMYGQLNRIEGVWIATGKIVTMTDPNRKVRPGFVFQDRFIITQNGTQATLRTSKGTVSGQFRGPSAGFSAGSWYFTKTVQMQFNLRTKSETIIMGGATTPMRGTTTTTYLGINHMTGQWYPIGGEVVSFTAVPSKN